MDMHTAGLACVFSPAAKVAVTGARNEDAYYDAYGRWDVPAWVERIKAAVRRLRPDPAGGPGIVLTAQTT